MQTLRLATIVLLLSVPCAAEEGPRLTAAWKASKLRPAYESYVIQGTGDRNNPLRRRLASPFAGRELYVRFTLRYAPESVDRPPQGDGEFFVLWLDREEGNDRSTHSGGIPNVGIHVHDGENRFMVRYGAGQQRFTRTRLVGGRDYHVVARLSKSKPGKGDAFDLLDVWVDPRLVEQGKPHASARTSKSISSVNWIGFSTGRKTENGDRITVADIQVASSWSKILGLPADVTLPARKQSPSSKRKPGMKTVSFREDVYPILKKHCFACHAGEKASSEIRLDVWDEMLNRTRPGQADASPLVARVQTADAGKRMPPPGEGRAALRPAEIAILKSWIDEGVEWDEQLLPTPRPASAHWAFQKVKRPVIPRPKNEGWVRTPIDAFIARRQERAGTVPAPLASAPVLRRRLALDLTGLPPDKTAFERLKDDSPAALHKAADAYTERLLASPAYGERWGRHWLDVARFGESNGHQHNRNRPHAWRYRDYVVRSFRQNKPFDRFLLEQIAGDELPFDDEHVIATGFLAAARYSGNELDKEIQRNDILVDVVNTTSKAFLGITLECAQCHTHKFDPISIRDYYRFQAYFTPGQPGNVVLTRDPRAQVAVNEHWQIFDRAQRRLIAGRRKKGVPEPILITPKTVYARLSSGENRLMRRAQRELAALPRSWAWYSPAMSSSGLAVAPHTMRWPLPRPTAALRKLKTFLRLRGDVKSRGPQVTAGWPAVFGPTPTTGSRSRMQLAKWMTSRDNPLTARVWVNRIWQWHFGRGLVASSDDFGTQGARPSHPELLDWLAAELMDHDWNTNHIHRLILQSNTFRQSSRFDSANHAADPENRTFWRWKVRRLESEAIRDSILSVSGLLDAKLGGPSVPVAQAGRSHRRSIYLQQKRKNLPGLLMAFDSPNAVVSCSRRRVSTVAPQALHLFNSRFAQQAANALAERVKASSRNESDWAARALAMVLARPPRKEEVAQAKRLLNETSLQSLCVTLLNFNEFLYIP